MIHEKMAREKNDARKSRDFWNWDRTSILARHHGYISLELSIEVLRWTLRSTSRSMRNVLIEGLEQDGKFTKAVEV